jgi:hypothetical protein
MKKLMFWAGVILATLPALPLLFVMPDVDTVVVIFLCRSYCALAAFGAIFLAAVLVFTKEEGRRAKLKKIAVALGIAAAIYPVSWANMKLSSHAANKYIEKAAREIAVLDTGAVAGYLRKNGWELDKAGKRYARAYRLTTIGHPLRLLFENGGKRFKGYVYYDIDKGYFVAGDLERDSVEIWGY